MMLESSPPERKTPDGDVGHHPLADALDQGLADRDERLRPVRQRSLRGRVDPERVGAQVDERHQPRSGRPVVAGRELLHVGAELDREGPQLGGGQHPVVDPRPVERLHAERVPGEHDVAVAGGRAEGVHPAHVVDALRAQPVDHVQDDLRVGVGHERARRAGSAAPRGCRSRRWPPPSARRADCAAAARRRRGRRSRAWCGPATSGRPVGCPEPSGPRWWRRDSMSSPSSRVALRRSCCRASEDRSWTTAMPHTGSSWEGGLQPRPTRRACLAGAPRPAAGGR